MWRFPSKAQFSSALFNSLQAPLEEQATLTDVA